MRTITKGFSSKRWIDGLAVVLFAAGVVAWVIDAPIPEATSAVVTPGPGVTASRPPAAGVAGSFGTDPASIVSGNMFSASRSAPAVRYNPPVGGGDAFAAADLPAETLPDQVASVPRVYGTVLGPAGAMALFQPDSAGASGRLYREGERVGAFRIEKILGSSVVLRGPGGRREVHVEERAEHEP